MKAMIGLILIARAKTMLRCSTIVSYGVKGRDVMTANRQAVAEEKARSRTYYQPENFPIFLRPTGQTRG